RRSESTKIAASRAAVAWSMAKISQTRVTIASIAVRPSDASQISVPTGFSVCSVLSSGETITASPSYTRQAALAFWSGYPSGSGDHLPDGWLGTEAEREAWHGRGQLGRDLEHA